MSCEERTRSGEEKATVPARGCGRRKTASQNRQKRQLSGKGQLSDVIRFTPCTLLSGSNTRDIHSVRAIHRHATVEQRHQACQSTRTQHPCP
eukprot:6440831-Alexandrium_andersonii.AAC.1